MTPAPEPLGTVALLRFGAVGDVVLTTGALAALARAWPETRIIYVTKTRLAPLLEAQPGVAHVLGVDDGESLGSVRRRLIAIGPGATIDLHDKVRSHLLRLAVPGRRVVWHKRDRWAGLAVRLRLSTYRPSRTIAARYHEAVETLVGRPLPRQPLHLAVRSAWQTAARERLAAAGYQEGQPLVGMAPGAMWPTKQWPAAQFAALAQRCRVHGWQVVLTGSSAEAELTATIAAAAPGTIDLGGSGDLTQLVGLVSLCRAFVANDSGPMHIARALSVPTVAFFGSTSPAQFDFAGHRLLFADLDCSPCSLYGLRRCPRGHLDCLRRLEVEPAWAALRELVDGPRPAPILG